jgi:toxin ParE1/3/4
LKVRFTPSARAQFLRALEYIRRDRPMAASNYRQLCEQTLRRLEEFPESGRKIPELPELPHRELIVAPYRFFYRISGDIVWVVAVWHGAQLPAPPEAGSAP